MRVIEHELSEELAIRLLGWKWVSFVDTPTIYTEGYPKECRVRQLFSPKQLASKAWSKFLIERDHKPATMDEPLSYHYSSSGSSVARLPRFIILAEEQD